MSDPSDYTVGWICALTTESVAAQVFLDETHEGPATQDALDTNSYTFGKIKQHNVVIAVLPMGEYGTASAAGVAKDMLRSFRNIRIGLMVGIGGGAPSSTNDIRLGDIVVSVPTAGQSGVFQYDFGKSIQEESFQQTRTLNQPPQALLSIVATLKGQHVIHGNGLEDAINYTLQKYPALEEDFSRPPQSTDILFQSTFKHVQGGDSCDPCSADAVHVVNRKDRKKKSTNPQVHYGTIASANTLMKDAIMRDRLASQKDVLCFEMEAAGLMNRFPCLVVRGICDYSDSHKNKEWQGFAAMAAAAYAKQIISRIRPEVIGREKTISDQLSEVSSGIAEILSDVKSLKLAQEDIDVLEWISDIDFGAQQTDTLSKWQPGTGQWLLDSDEFQKWAREKSEILLCPGIPGSGKTILTSLVIEQLTYRFRKDQKTGIAYIYCDFRRRSTQQSRNLLASILKQLCQRGTTIPASIRTMYLYHDKGKTGLQPSEIWEALRSIARTYSKLFVIVDALDEWQVSEREQSNLVDELLRLQKELGVSLFATTRPIPMVVGKFRPHPILTISASHDDICWFIDNYQRQLPNFLNNDPDLKQHIKTSISKAAKGMFLLASLYLQSLETKTTKRSLSEALSKLELRAEQKALDQRNVLDEAYDEAMERLEQQNPDHRELAFEVLTWICCTYQKLSIDALGDALALRDGDTEIHKDGIPEVDLLVSVCCGLVVFDDASRALRLIHYTTQDYFDQKQQRWFPNAQATIAKRCMHYLSIAPFEDGPCVTDFNVRRRLFDNPLYTYAALEWDNHARNAATSDHVDEMALDFLNRSQNVSAAMQVILLYSTNPSTGLSWSWHFKVDYSRRSLISINGLHLAAFCGLSNLVPILTKGFGINSEDDKGWTSFSWAFIGGHITAIESVLRQNPDLGLQRKQIRDFLIVAVMNGHQDWVKLLLDHGADPRTTIDYGQSALMAASRYGHEAIVELLLDKGADPNWSPGGHRSALMIASEQGHMAIVELLLEQGAQLHLRDIEGRTALMQACVGGRQGILELYIGKGADPSLEDNNGDNTVMLASIHGHATILSLLLEMGNDPDLSGTGAALSRASKQGHAAIVKLLLEHRAAASGLKPYSYGAPILEAISGGHENVLESLLDAGADMEAQDKDGDTPIFFASRQGNTTLVRKLIESGADFNSPGSRDGKTPIMVAQFNNHKHVVQLLRDNGASFISHLNWAPRRTPSSSSYPLKRKHLG
ncbi:hypothetical protein FSARC_3642 [Fusarium sarcochroum]|uniref:Nucleoside phosphorylase domain-containing protein n=1 Tax=Fusarium sarcochroum TaxID=1208366 RepID=A0A8H4XBG1_9HYPO|nr:hypothetical protein FSARC_3642 [Fusarium sarcochroum]